MAAINGNGRMLTVVTVEDFGDDPCVFLVEADERILPTADDVRNVLLDEAYRLIHAYEEYEAESERWEQIEDEEEYEAAYHEFDGPYVEGVTDALCWLTGEGRRVLEKHGIHVLGEGDRPYNVVTVWSE